MIISWEHNFVFVKPLKTGGTSVEAALSRICGPQDVLTPWFPYWETHRAGYKPFNYRTVVDCSQETGEHWGLDKIESVIRKRNPDFWNSSRKVTLIRNPFAVVVSNYYFKYWLDSYPWYKIWHDMVMYPERLLHVRFFRLKLRGLIRAYYLNTHHELRGRMSARMVEWKACRPLANDSLTVLRKKFSRYLSVSNNFRGLLLDIPGNLNKFDRVFHMENISSELPVFCEELGVVTPAIPRFKTSQKMHKYYFSEYYTPEAVELVSAEYQSIIDAYNYSL